MNYKKSQILYNRACEIIPGGVNSPVRAFKSVGSTPIYVKKGKGPHIYDVDGNRYIDLCMSWGPLILGHAHSRIKSEVRKAIAKGLTFGTCTENEVKMADILTRNIPHCEMVRMVSSGTEAVMSAIRVARGFTNRQYIVKFEGCYHGHSDGLLVKAGSGLSTFGTPSSRGVPDDIAKLTIVLPLDSEEAVINCFEKYKGKIAAVIIEPIPANNGLLLQRPEYLQFLREITEKNGSLLIFDEVISGFRVSFGGAAEHYKIKPDLVTYGKILGGGFPIAAYGGRRDVMLGLSPLSDIYQAGTLSGNPVGLRSGIATLKMLKRDKIYAEINKNVKIVVNGINEIINETKIDATLFSCESILWLYFDRVDKIRNANQIKQDAILRYNRFFHLMLNEKIYLPPSGYEVWFWSLAHDETIAHFFLKAFGRAFRQLASE